MDELLAKAGSQAVTFAVKSGVSLASSYAIKTISSLLIQIPKSESSNFVTLKTELEDRIDIISAAIDLIKLVAARGNTNLQSTLKITANLERDVKQFDDNIQALVHIIENSKNEKAKNEAIHEAECYIKDLLKRIQEITPYINLALTTSGANLSTSLPKSVSPGLLLQASNHIFHSNEIFKGNHKSSIAVGPSFECTLFTIFYNINIKDHINWKEDMKRAIVTMYRVPSESTKDLFKYTLKIKQSFDDERYHNTEDGDEVPRELTMEIRFLEKIFFSVSGKLLKLEERDSPVLILKETKSAGRTQIKDSDNKTNWYALGSYESASTDSEHEESTDDDSEYNKIEEKHLSTSIGLLEYIIRLTSLQQNDQCDMLGIDDERLSIYLNDENPNSIQKGVLDVNSITKKINDMKLEDK